MLSRLASLRQGGAGKTGRRVAVGVFLFFLIKGLIWLGVFAAAAWSAYRFAG